MLPTQEGTGAGIVYRSLLLVAGNGALPLMLLKSMQEKGIDLAVCAIDCEASPELKILAKNYTTIKVGQLKKMLNFISKVKPEAVIFLGGVCKRNFLKNFRPDWLAAKILASVRTLEDDKLLRAIARLVEDHGSKVISVADVAPEMLVTKGLLTARDLSPQGLADAGLGVKAAEMLGELDIGQAVVIYKGAVLALEAVEGTDLCIKRAGQLANLLTPIKQNGLVLVKFAKPNQDLRLDLPTVGLTTLELARENSVSAIVLEAGKCLLEKPVEFKRRADQLGIAVKAL